MRPDRRAHATTRRLDDGVSAQVWLQKSQTSDADRGFSVRDLNLGGERCDIRIASGGLAFMIGVQFGRDGSGTPLRTSRAR